MKLAGGALALLVAVVIAAAVIGSAIYGAADTIHSAGLWGAVAVAGPAAVLAALAWRDSRR